MNNKTQPTQKIYNHNDCKLRLKCFEIISQCRGNYSPTVFDLIGSEVVYNYITKGELPLDADGVPVTMDVLFGAALEKIKEQRNDGNETKDLG